MKCSSYKSMHDSLKYLAKEICLTRVEMCEVPTHILILSWSYIKHYISHKSLVIEVFLMSKINTYFFSFWENNKCLLLGRGDM